MDSAILKEDGIKCIDENEALVLHSEPLPPLIRSNQTLSSPDLGGPLELELTTGIQHWAST